MARSASALVVFALALAMRLAFVHEVAGSPLGRLSELRAADMYWYERWGFEISQGDWLGRDLSLLYTDWQDRVATREEWEAWFSPRLYNAPPLYLYFVAGVYSVAGRDPAAVWIAQALLGAAGCVLLYGIARRAFGETAGRVAGVAGALYGPSIFYDGVLLRTSLIAFTQLAVVGALLAADRSRKRGAFALAGASAGLAVLAQPTAFALAVVALVWLGVRARSRRAAAAALLAFAIGFAVPLSALVARNLAVQAPAFAIASRGPFALVVGNIAEPLLGGVGFTIPESAIQVLRDSEFRLLPALFGTLATHDSLGAFAAFQARKLLAAFSDFEVYNNVNYYYFAAKLALLRYLPHFAHIAGLGLVGLVLALRGHRDAPEPERGARALLVLYALYAMFACTVSLVLSRYRMPLVGALILYAGFAGAWLGRAVAARRAQAAAVGVAATLAVGLLVASNPAVRLHRFRAAEPLGVAEILARDGTPSAAAGELEAAVPLLEGQPRAQALLLRGAARYRASIGERARARALLRRAEALQPGERE